MEVVLLWLDELDDLVFAAALLAHRLRRLALGFAAVAAAALGFSMLDVLSGAWALESAYIAALGVALWLSTGLVGERGAARNGRARGRASAI